MTTRRTIDKRFREMSERQLVNFIKQQGKVANQRLRSLEGKAKTTQGKQTKATTDYSESSNAYLYTKRKAEQDEANAIYSRTAKGEIKFSTATRNVDVQILRERATAISRFLSARTSTQTGTREVHREAFEKFVGANPSFAGVSEDEFAKFWREAVIKNFKEQYGTGQIPKLKYVAGDLTTEEIVQALESVGFTADTDYDKGDRVIGIKTIHEALRKARKGRERK